MAHPMLYSITPSNSRINSKKKSYAAWEFLQYQTLGKAINKWRMKTLRLPPIHGSLMQNTIPKEKIPFSAMFSPSLIPKPKDWPEQCRVVGTCRFKDGSNEEFSPISAGFGELMEWLKAGPKPVFLGFGSMIIENTDELALIIIQAAAKAKCRILVQSGWSKIDVSLSVKGQDLPDCGIKGPLCFNVGSCPHDWLLPHCSAVIHHGGAGTTASGLEHGLPTFICPFFADQYLWADKVFEAGVGPKFCPVKELDVNILADALQELKKPSIKKRAKKMAKAMKTENGIQGAIDHFMDFLPVDNMFCDVSMIMGEVRRARYFLPGSNLKVSVEFAALVDIRKEKITLTRIHSFHNLVTELGASHMRRYAVTKYSISGVIHNIFDGLYYGIVGLLFQISIQAPYKLFHLPDKYAYRYGAIGFCCGCIMGPFGVALKILYAILYFIDCIALGVVNGCSKPENKRDYICNLFRKDSSYVYRLENIELERQMIQKDFQEPRFIRLLKAFEVAVAARQVFNSSNPKENQIHKIVEVKAEDLYLNVSNMSFLNETNKKKLMVALSNMGDVSLSFSHLCKLLNVIAGDEIIDMSDEKKVEVFVSTPRKSTSEMHWDIYSDPCRFDDDIENPSVDSMNESPSVNVHSSTRLKITPRTPSESWTFNIPGIMSSTRSSSFDGSGARRLIRGRTISDGFAEAIDKFSETVAGGRVRSNSPKARYPSPLRGRTFSDNENSGSIRRIDDLA